MRSATINQNGLCVGMLSGHDRICRHDFKQHCLLDSERQRSKNAVCKYMKMERRPTVDLDLVGIPYRISGQPIATGFEADNSTFGLEEQIGWYPNDTNPQRSDGFKG